MPTIQFLIFGLLQIADAITTHQGLSDGYSSEVGPIIRGLLAMGCSLTMTLLMVKCGTLVIGNWMAYGTRPNWMWFMNGLYCVVVVNNLVRLM